MASIIHRRTDSSSLAHSVTDRAPSWRGGRADRTRRRCRWHRLPEYSVPFDNGWMVEPFRLLDALASSVVAFATQRLPIGCDIRVDSSRERVDSWNMVQPCDPAPKSKVACDLIGRVRSNVDGVIGCYQPHARVEVALNESWESLREPLRLPGNELERVVPIPSRNPGYPATTERALTIVNDGRLAW